MGVISGRGKGFKFSLSQQGPRNSIGPDIQHFILGSEGTRVSFTMCQLYVQKLTQSLSKYCIYVTGKTEGSFFYSEGFVVILNSHWLQGYWDSLPR